MDPLDRILDANFNRAREALRVLEDLFRFGRDDAAAQESLKGLRHRLAAMERPLSGRLLSARDSVRDVGRRLDLSRSGTLADLAAANFKRLEEALRSIEEASRGREPAVRGAAASLRFDAYDAEKRFLPPLIRRIHLERVHLYVLLDPQATHRPLARVARQAVRGGAEMLQLRMKGRSAADVKRAAAEIVRIAHGEGALLIVNDRLDPAADGVHVGRNDPSIAQARSRLPADAIVGATTHSFAAARRARAADYLSCGPMFATPLKPHLAARGLDYWSRAKALGVPLFAIGGITRERLPGLVRRGIDRIAVCSGVIAQPDVEKAARAMRRMLGERG
ncbi:MAG: thiamine phosphate synthase [Planctomycetes bacterium]|nr:thiamine phosphate synthase [Planctomycetota bacterium]